MQHTVENILKLVQDNSVGLGTKFVCSQLLIELLTTKNLHVDKIDGANCSIIMEESNLPVEMLLIHDDPIITRINIESLMYRTHFLMCKSFVEEYKIRVSTNPTLSTIGNSNFKSAGIEDKKCLEKMSDISYECIEEVLSAYLNYHELNSIEISTALKFDGDLHYTHKDETTSMRTVDDPISMKSIMAMLESSTKLEMLKSEHSIDMNEAFIIYIQSKIKHKARSLQKEIELMKKDLEVIEIVRLTLNQ